jgi:hypothetical protein
MRFTVVFSGPVHEDRSYGLVFIPCPVWKQGPREIMNLHPENPNYLDGDLRRLMTAEKLMTADRPERVTIVVHSDGHATPGDLAALVGEATSLGLVTSFAGTLDPRHPVE